MSILPELKERFRRALAELADDAEELLAMIRRSQDPKFGDYQANLAMPLGKRLGRPPREVAAELLRRLDLADLCESVEIAGPGFINLRIRESWLVKQLTAALGDPRLGVAPVARPRKFVVDYSAPNVAKPMHVGPYPLDGHRRRPVPDIEVRRPRGDERQSHRRLGHAVRHDPLRLQAFPRPRGLSAKPIDELARLYRLRPPMVDWPSGRRRPDVAAAVLAETAKLHAGDAENLRLWREFLPVCLEDIERIYRRLHVHFDHTLGESFYNDQLAAIVEELLDRGIARTSDGAVCVFLAGQRSPMIVRKQDGAFLYATTDLATIRYRMDQWQPDAILYVVDHRQGLHFQQLFAVARLLGYERGRVPARQFRHRVGRGRPAFPHPRRRHRRPGGPAGRGGRPGRRDRRGQRRRQARRTGAFRRRAGPRRRDRGHCRLEIRRPFAEPHQRLRLQLRQDAGHERQHGHVHAIRLRPGAEHLRPGQGRHRGPAGSAAPILLDSPAERALALELLRFSEALDLALADYRPNQLTAYLFDLANRYSTFFEQCHVLRAESDALRQQPLALVRLDRPDDPEGPGSAGHPGGREDVAGRLAVSSEGLSAVSDRCAMSPALFARSIFTLVLHNTSRFSAIG